MIDLEAIKARDKKARKFMNLFSNNSNPESHCFEVGYGDYLPADFAALIKEVERLREVEAAAVKAMKAWEERFGKTW